MSISNFEICLIQTIDEFLNELSSAKKICICLGEYATFYAKYAFLIDETYTDFSCLYFSNKKAKSFSEIARVSCVSIYLSKLKRIEKGKVWWRLHIETNLGETQFYVKIVQ